MASWKEQIAAAHAEVINEIKKEFGGIKGGPSITESVKAFCAAIDWSVCCLVCIISTTMPPQPPPPLIAFCLLGAGTMDHSFINDSSARIHHRSLF